MRIGLATTLSLALALGACAGDDPQPMGRLGYAPTTMAAPAAEATASNQQDIEARRAAKNSIAARTLAAIALERVTGLKPDPMRLREGP